MPQVDALQRLGIERICCRTQILSPTTYSLFNAQRGTITPSVLNTNFPSKSFALTTANREAYSVDLSSSGLTTEIEIPSDAGPSDVPRSLPGSSAPLVSLESIEPRVDSDFNLDDLKFGEVLAVNYERDTSGNIVQEDVGLGYKVPRLQILYKL